MLTTDHKYLYQIWNTVPGDPISITDLIATLETCKA